MIDVLTLAGDKIAAVTGFLALNPEQYPGATLTGAELFARFGLPAEPTLTPWRAVSRQTPAWRPPGCR